MKPVMFDEVVTVDGTTPEIFRTGLPSSGFIQRVIVKRLTGSGNFTLQLYENESAANQDPNSEDDADELPPELYKILSADLANTGALISSYVTAPSPGVPYACNKGGRTPYGRLVSAGAGEQKFAVCVVATDDVQ